MKPILSILIATVSTRELYLNRLLVELEKQIVENSLENNVEILVYKDSMENSVGEKANLLIKKAKGHYLVGLGDDDMVNKDYVKTIVDTIESNPKVDQITFDMLLKNSLTKNIYKLKFSKENKQNTIKLTNGLKFILDVNVISLSKKLILYKGKRKLSSFNLLNIIILYLADIFKLVDCCEFYTWPTMVVKKEICDKIEFSDRSREQDLEWSLMVRDSNLIKTEITLNKEMYYYNYDPSMSIDRDKDRGFFKTKPLDYKLKEIKLKITYI